MGDRVMHCTVYICVYFHMCLCALDYHTDCSEDLCVCVCMHVFVCLCVGGLVMSL